jgi:hypothetical protein
MGGAAIVVVVALVVVAEPAAAAVDGLLFCTCSGGGTEAEAGGGTGALVFDGARPADGAVVTSATSETEASVLLDPDMVCYYLDLFVVKMGMVVGWNNLECGWSINVYSCSVVLLIVWMLIVWRWFYENG